MQQKYGPGEYGFVPLSFVLPEQCNEANQTLFPNTSNSTTNKNDQDIKENNNNNNSSSNSSSTSNSSTLLSRGCWILKPYDSSRGRGIYVLNPSTRKDKPFSPQKKCIISQYVDNPLLIEQLKFDMRIYALVTSFDPLVVYCYQEGLARFATEQ